MNPLVTYILYAFNEERFIREAIESAFAQTYSPLEIVLSDDGSTDRTYAIMEEMTAAYSGPHTIILNRNEKNIGIGSQLNAAWHKSRGELFVLANGDDVSLPERVSRTVEAWLEGIERAMGVTANLATMDAEGRPMNRLIRPRTEYPSLREAVRYRCGPVLAASLAIDRQVFKRFGDLMPALILEDGPLFLRAMLLGPTRHIEEPLVRYRIHKENISQAYAVEDYESWAKRHHEKATWQTREGVKAYLQMLGDLYSNEATNYGTEELERARWVAAEKLAEQQMLAAYYQQQSAVPLRMRIASLWRLGRLAVKLSIKTLLPFIQRRNTRWHYRSVVRAASAASREVEHREA